ncbi:MAG: DUF2334 domain-containing protein [Acidobacteria bacterium]|nr:DUF2334 domain-containing protein [Acidobacteriota bacterium]
MSARYLLRFDDICPTMNWDVWNEVEAILQRHDICPLLAVVPDNQDPELQCFPAVPDFWDRVRRWQLRGWAIALHGFQHKFITADAGLIGLNHFSEFAGLSQQDQLEKLEQALAIFQQENITPNAWSAPAHSFDQITLQCLSEKGPYVISDGLFLYPQTDSQGLFWVPQQLSDFRSFPFGVYTVCFHPNHWDRTQLQDFERNIVAYQSRLTSLPEIIEAYKNRKPLLSAATLAKWGGAALRLKQRLRLRHRLFSAARKQRGMT